MELGCTPDDPSMIEEPEMLILLDENDMGDAGNLMYDSVLILALL